MHREEAAEHGRAQHEDKHEESAIDVRHELETRPRFDEHEQKVGEPTPLGHLRVASHTWPRPSPRQRSQIAFCDDAKQKRAGEASRVRVTMTNCHAQIQKKDKLFLIPGEGCVAAEEGASVGALTACAARGGETLVDTRTSCRSPRATHTCAARGCETLVGTRTSCRSPPCHDVRGSEIVGWLSAASSARAESATEGESTIFPPIPAPLMRGSTVAPRFRTVSSMCVCRNVSAKLRARAGQERERPEPLFEGDFGPNQDRAWLRGSWMDVLSRRAAGNCFLQRAPRSELGQQVPHRRRERKGGSVRTRPCTLLV